MAIATTEKVFFLPAKRNFFHFMGNDRLAYKSSSEFFFGREENPCKKPPPGPEMESKRLLRMSKEHIKLQKRQLYLIKSVEGNVLVNQV